MKEPDRLLTSILDLGRKMVYTGADVWHVDDVLRRICGAYGYKSCDMEVMTDHIDATVQTEDDEIFTQIREVPGRKYDMDKLEHLAVLAEDTVTDTPEPNELQDQIDGIMDRPGYDKGILLLASAFGAANFTMFYNGYRQDVMLIGLFTILISFLKDFIGKREGNPLIYNTLLAYLMEIMAIVAMLSGAGRSLTSMTAGLIIFLISGRGITTGMRDLLHENTLAGVTDSVNSLLGAMGISIGVSLALLTFGQDVLQHIEEQEVVHNPIVQLIGSIGGCIGFAIIFNCRGRVLVLTGLGAGLTLAIYRLTLHITDGNYFTATLMAACGAAVFANIIAILIKTPPTVFMTTCIFPLIPGASLYQTVYAIIMDDRMSYHANGRKLFLVCVAIALGFIIVEVVFKYGRMLRLYLMNGSKGGNKEDGDLYGEM